MQDLLYYFDKSTFERIELGEIQTAFNMSFVIDGTKDSCKVIVNSYIEEILTPNTICHHLATNTWWIIANDKVERYENEQGYFYSHTLQLEGAIELLNARDLTDSGFNENRYSVGDFINRLFALSNFEFNQTAFNNDTENQWNLNIITNNNISLDKNVDYIKTFENYTLLSALREFLDGYNCVAKLSFNTQESGVDTYIIGATISIVSKTGNANKSPIIADNVFNDIRQIRNLNKSNYGTSVISNADNVISTKSKTYPSAGGVRLSSRNGMAVRDDNAILRLPSNIFKINYIDITKVSMPFGYAVMSNDGLTQYKLGNFNPYDKESINSAYTQLKNAVDSWFQGATYDDFDESIFNNAIIRIPYCDNYNAVNNTFISDQTLPTCDLSGENGETYANDIQMVVSQKDLGDNVFQPRRVISYSRGSDTIDNFQCFSYSHNQLKINMPNTQKRIDQNVSLPWVYIYVGTAMDSPYDEQIIYIKDACFTVNYIPMSDLKIKVDNYGDTIDSVLYNQNGKLTDSNAFSKILLSYSKEIESDTITRYGDYYGGYSTSNGFDKGKLPSVGDIVDFPRIENNQTIHEYYVINNLSVDIYPNESNLDIGYFMKAQVSLSKKVATKSLLTSPNTNIRDYGIPQNNNVRRKQLFRDFFEFNYETIYSGFDGDYPQWYQPIGNIVNLNTQANQYKEHIATIRAIFNNKVNGSFEYYYQLETTTYFLKKSVYEVVDFKDNNIIGYGYQNLWSGFDISKILLSPNELYDLYTIPISYVDNQGEIKTIEMYLSTIDDLKLSYDNYLTSQSYDPTQTIDIYNTSVFIPSEIYTYIRSHNLYDIELSATNYKKDALEVPVFEYSAQVDDSDNILVGENILERGNNDKAYLFSYILVPEGMYDDNNYMLLENYILPINVAVNNQATNNYAVRFDTTYLNDTSEPYFTMKLYESEIIDIDDFSVVSTGNVVPISNASLEGKTLLVIRHTLTNSDLYTNVVGTLASNEVQTTLPSANASVRGKCVVFSDGTYAVCEPDAYTLTLTTDIGCKIQYTITRLGVVVLTGEVGVNTTETISVLQDDYYELTAIPNGSLTYYINGDDTNNDYVNGDVSWSPTSLAYRTLTIKWSPYLTEIWYREVGASSWKKVPRPSDVPITSTYNHLVELTIKQGLNYEWQVGSMTNGYYPATYSGNWNTTSGNYTIDIVSALAYQTIAFTKNTGIASFTITISFSGGSQTYTWNNSNSVGNIRQDITYSYSVVYSTGFQSNGTGTGSGTVGANASNTLTISPTADRITYQITFYTNVDYGVYYSLTYTNATTGQSATERLDISNHYATKSLPYGSTYSWVAYSSTGFTKAISGGSGSATLTGAITHTSTWGEIPTGNDSLIISASSNRTSNYNICHIVYKRNASDTIQNLYLKNGENTGDTFRYMRNILSSGGEIVNILLTQSSLQSEKITLTSSSYGNYSPASVSHSFSRVYEQPAYYELSQSEIDTLLYLIPQ